MYDKTPLLREVDAEVCGGAGGDQPAFLLERLFASARAKLNKKQSGLDLAFDEIEAKCRETARDLARLVPTSGAIIGFDRPANIYVVTEFYRAGGHRRLLEQLIRAQPAERHIVLFTGALSPDYHYCRERMIAAGAFPLFPDLSLGLFDRLNWLREKLSAFAGQRVYCLHHPEDVLAAIALHEQAPRLGKRLYVVRHADTVPSVGVDFPQATHLAMRSEQMRQIRAKLPQAHVFVLPLTLDREGPFEKPKPAPVPPPPATLLARAASLFRQQPVQGQAPGPNFAPFQSSRFVTATAGTAQKYQLDGPRSLPSVIARVLRVTQGRHVHVGRAPSDLQNAVRQGLREAGLEDSQVVFAGEVESVADTLIERQVDLFLGSFPIGGALTMAEAAAASIPIASYAGDEDEQGRYLSGQDYGPDKKLLWHSPDELTDLLGQATQAKLQELSAASERWFIRSCRSVLLPRRLKAIRAVVEGKRRAPFTTAPRAEIISVLLDRQFYLREYPDVAASEMDPLDHYLSFGESEHRCPNALFDPAFYLSQVSEGDCRDYAQAHPLLHYVLRGEMRGLRPNVLFDPAVYALSCQKLGKKVEDAVPGLLAAYIADPGHARPHQFFDPAHYARQLPLPVEDESLLAHFFHTGMSRGYSPHPLLAISDLKGDRLHFLKSLLRDRKPAADEPVTSLLFEPAVFAGDQADFFSRAAPTLLWAHLIEGNLTGRDPHKLISVSHIENMRMGTLVGATTALELLSLNRLGVDTHPLVETDHILRQLPYIAAQKISATEFFLRNAASHNISPHPLFSTQHYLYTNQDVAKAGINPLMHFLAHGQWEGRSPHPAFNSRDYYERFLRNRDGGSPIMHYLTQGRSLFRSTLPMDLGTSWHFIKFAVAMLEAGSENAAAQRMAESVHPGGGAPHPSLRTGVHPLVTDTQEATHTKEIFPGETLRVDRPKVVSTQYISPPSGSVDVPAATSSVYEMATIVGGNDGFLSAGNVWVDHGLLDFDHTYMHVKESAAVAAVFGSKVLLRYYEGGRSLPAGIFAMGTYSRNYFHFLFEVLPRVILADRIAPAEVAILTDADMPSQHYQALRMLFPARPILRLPRHVTCRVGRLFVGSMPTIIHDAFGKAMPPVHSTRFHSQVIRELADRFRHLSDETGPKRAYLDRNSNLRKLLNAEEIRSELTTRRGFDVIDTGGLTFSQQVRKMGRVKEIVGQSGAHLANMLFAPEGTRVFPLYSNAPGTNFYFWSQLGAILGHEVINIAGWRIEGTASGVAPEAHEDFSVPKSLVTSFFSKLHDDLPPPGSARAWALCDRLYHANDEAEALTGAWSTRAGWTPSGFEEKLIAWRQSLLTSLETLGDAEIEKLLSHRFFVDFSRNVRSGFTTLRGFNAAENAALEALRTRFAALSVPAAEADVLNARDLALAMVYMAAWQLPLVTNINRVESKVRAPYLRWLIGPPYLFRAGDDAGYVAFAARLLDWLADHLAPDRPEADRLMVVEVARAIDLGQIFLVGEPARPVLEARNRLLARIVPNHGPAPREMPRPMDLSQGRIRIGILCRTFDKGPDSEAVVSFFRSFDHGLFEVFAYSVGFSDRVVSSDSSFTYAFDAAIEHRRLLPSDPYAMRERILADDLDVFLLANATTVGVREQELALFRRVAPVQLALNSHVPVAPGFPSFDGFITGRSDDPAEEVSGADVPERLIRVDGPVINYLNSFNPRPASGFDRKSLGIGANEFVMLNAGSLQKLRHECLATMLRALAASPNARLVLAPYNPGWVARSQAFAFNRTLAEAAEEVGVSLDRILVLGELSVAEAEAAVALSDIYLSSFPHGGATMTHLALINGVPPVVLRRRDTRSIDQFLVSSLGLSELLASSTDDYVMKVSALSADAERCEALAKKVRAAARQPVFVANDDFSRSMQQAIVGELSRAYSGAQIRPDAQIEPGAPHRIEEAP